MPEQSAADERATRENSNSDEKYRNEKRGKDAAPPSAPPRARPRTETATTPATTPAAVARRRGPLPDDPDKPLRPLHAERRMEHLRNALGSTGTAGQPTQHQQGRDRADRFDLLERNRRQNVLDLWARGYNVAAIARSLQISRQTVQNDIAYLQGELQRDILPELRQRLSRSAMVRMTIQQEAWQLYTRLDDKAHNKVAALELAMKAQDGLDRIQGIAAPEEVNVAALIEMQEATMAALLSVGGVAAQQAFVAALRERSTLGFNPLQLPPLPSDREVEADAADGPGDPAAG